MKSEKLNWCGNPKCGHQAYRSHLVCKACWPLLPREMRLYIARLAQWELFRQWNALRSFIATWFSEPPKRRL